MALGLTEEHLQLAETVRGWAERHCPPETVRAAAGGPDGGSALYLESLAPGLAGQGLLGLHLPEEDGGQGFGLPELTVALEELGRALVPGSFLPTVFASAALVAAGVSGKLVTGLADGSKAGAVSLAPGLTGTADAAGDGTAGGGLVVEGESGPVLGASMADLVIVPVQTDDGEVWAAVDASSLEITALDSLDLTRPVARVRADRAAVPADRILTGLDRRSVTSLAAILFGAEASGIADRVTHAAADYAKIRHQFGRPIGQFQAVKHRCAWMLTAAEQAAAAVWDAARTDAEAAAGPGEPGRQREFAAGAAAVVAIDAAVGCAHQYIQVLGGIGYTWEHEAHLYYRRAMSLRALLGPSHEWAEQVARLALSGVSRPVQVELTGGDAQLREQIRAELSAIAQLTGAERTQKLADDGWVVPHLPRPWGRGASPLEQVVIHQEMRAAGVRAPGLVIGAWVVPALIQYGTEQQQQLFLPPTLRGELMWCQLFSEPGAGSDLAGLTTRAVRVEGDGETGGGWKLTGQKIWTSLAKQAAWAICIARTDPAAPKHDGITYFLVDMSAPGVEVRPLREITGDSLFNEVFLDEVFVPDDCVVGAVNGGWRVARTTLANERVSLSQSWAFGSGVPDLLEMAKTVPDAPLGQVGTLVCEGHAIDLLAVRVTLKQLSGTEPGATGSVRKLLGMRHAQQVSEVCFALSGPGAALGGGAGGSGQSGAHWSRQVLLTEAFTIGGGTTDIQLNIIGERILGLPRDPEPPAA
jgi:alkylation response protein AidB-like acyl-CoA dehydrogenase